MRKAGKPMPDKGVIEEILMEVQAQAMAGVLEFDLKDEVRAIFKNIIKASLYAQAVNQGLRTYDHRFNCHLLELMGNERLN